ncbi:MAG: SAM-dependent methyltransferase [Planctomycetota bacterium]
MVLFAVVTTSTSCLSAEAQREGTKEKREPDVVFIPTPNNVVDMMLHLARVKKDDVVYDLGCGDGRIVVEAAKKYGCRAAGYDIDPKRVKESRRNVRENKVGHLVTIDEKDIFTLDLGGANVLALYLLPSLNVRLIPQLEKLKPGCRIVSHDFDMAGVRPDACLTMWSDEDERNHHVYLWTTPLKKEPVEEQEELADLPDEWEVGAVSDAVNPPADGQAEPAPGVIDPADKYHRHRLDSVDTGYRPEEAELAP